MLRLVPLAMLIVAGVTACSAPERNAGAAATTTAMPIPSRTAEAGATATPSPSPTPSASPGVSGTYLALGDSLAVGAGATASGETGYVARLYRALSEAEASPQVAALRNLAVGGETSTSMIRDGQLVDALDAIATADPPVILVTLDIGGNDLLRLLGTEACAADPLGQECLQLLALTLNDFETNYEQILSELTLAVERHAPDARIAVMTYFNPFSGTDAAHEAAAERALLGVDDAVDCAAALEPLNRGMNDIIVCVGQELGALPVDVQPAFAGLGLELTHIASEDIHANDRGYEVIAELFVAELATAAR